eukprot:SAG22_NODE_81_length_21778_cov_38.345173_3_plen_100_part_00
MFLRAHARAPGAAVVVACSTDSCQHEHEHEGHPKRAGGESPVASGGGRQVDVHGVSLHLLHVDRNHLGLACHCFCAAIVWQTKRGKGRLGSGGSVPKYM